MIGEESWGQRLGVKGVLAPVCKPLLRVDDVTSKGGAALMALIRLTDKKVSVKPIQQLFSATCKEQHQRIDKPQIPSKKKHSPLSKPSEIFTKKRGTNEMGQSPHSEKRHTMFTL